MRPLFIAYRSAGAILTVVAIAWNSAIVFFGAELSLFLYRWTSNLWGAA